ncbi:4-hydroxybenzoate 3-monooxygenase [Streptomyces sp. A1547]|uniref:4-hydroxybenzoate 3-monooxygenase n=1 Tax=Streptomyces sp. A1547 TaxID=2563105 RepID=UPI0019CF54E2|nr:4-hydroxybenzoate 3-monooxygenase [Streptomyces sp. A1547]
MTESQNSRALRESADVIVLGAGPAGLVLGNLLHAAGIDCVLLERASRTHVQTRARAGFLAPNTGRILARHGLADGLHRRGLRHGTCEFRTEDGRFRLDYGSLGQGGQQHHVYPQQNLVTDLLTHYLGRGGRIRFQTEALAVREADGTRPYVTTREPDGRPTRWSARYVAGCDGRHGAARRSLPPGAVRRHHDHGVTWLGLLAEAPPSLDAVGYAIHDRGFAGHMARTADVTRYYLQWQRGIPADAWAEQRIWDELDDRMRAADHGPLHRGTLLERGIFDLTCDVTEPLRHGSLFLAGDAASLLAPAAAKGTNLAVLEAEILAGALTDALTRGDTAGLDRYSDQCLAHIWRAQEFTGWMTRLLHTAPGGDQDAGSFFHAALRRSRLASLRTSRIHQEWFAENYVGV